MLPADDDTAADMYEHAVERLARAGYAHYEISNWAPPGHECRHNLTYWHNLPYIGLGAGAHSCYAGHRFAEARPIAGYIARVRAAVARGERARRMRCQRAPSSTMRSSRRNWRWRRRRCVGLRAQCRYLTFGVRRALWPPFEQVCDEAWPKYATWVDRDGRRPHPTDGAWAAAGQRGLRAAAAR